MKVVKVFLVLVVLALLGALATGFIVDELTSADIESKLKAVEVPTTGGSSISASISRTGKLSDPNGPLEYYGAILLQTKMDYPSVVSYYKTKSTDDLDIKVVSQEQAKATFGDDFPEDLRFSHHDVSPKGYYIVYAFGKGRDPFPMLDFRSYT